MYISKENAQQIVTEISTIINQHVNMMDEGGCIIASTDPQRIGSHHTAAAKIIAEQLEELAIFDDAQYAGARKGINLPVMLGEKIVGAIGVTGEYDEVSKYSRILKKMTEILLLENYSTEQKKLDERIRSRFLSDWLNYDGIAYSRVLLDRGNRVGIDITVPRRVFVAEIVDIARYGDSMEGQRLIDAANQVTRRMVEGLPHGVFSKTTYTMIGIVPDAPDADMLRLGERLRRAILRELKVEVKVGVDQAGGLLKTAYQRAGKALAACKYSEGGVYFYSDSTFEIFMDEVSNLSKREFLRRVFRGFSDQEVEGWIQLLTVYYNANASIKSAAEELFIHKNTLQYKLNKLAETTGYDPRRYRDAALYNLAIQFYDEGRLLS